jgi:hypothetical protein
MGRRLAGPLVADMTAQGIDRTQLRAQVAVSALVGITLGRSLGWFDEIRSVPRDELVALIVDGLGAITEDGPRALVRKRCDPHLANAHTNGRARPIGSFDLILPDVRSSALHRDETVAFEAALRGRLRPTGSACFIVEHDVALIQWTCERIYMPDCCERRPTLLKIQSGRIGC